MGSKFINSLGIARPEKDTKVVVAMSGGVDSSTVAGLMKSEGYNITGVTLKLYDDSKSSIKTRQCCAGQDIMDAKKVANQLNIDHKILYYQKKFKKDVIDSFVDSYLAGETPIPCVQCNLTVMFRDLYLYSKEEKAEIVKDFYKKAGDPTKSKPMPILKYISRIQQLYGNDKTDEYGNHLEPQFQKGDKITYLSHPGVITGVNKTPDGKYTYNVSYDKGEGKTKVPFIFNKGGEIKKA